MASRKHSDSLSERVRVFARGAGQFTLDEAAKALAEDRRRVQQAILGCEQRGELVRLERGRFRMASVADAELHPVVAKPQPPKGGEVEHRLNRLAFVLNEAHSELSELRRDLRISETLGAARPAIPMRCAEPWELEG